MQIGQTPQSAMYYLKCNHWEIRRSISCFWSISRRNYIFTQSRTSLWMSLFSSPKIRKNFIRLFTRVRAYTHAVTSGLMTRWPCHGIALSYNDARSSLNLLFHSSTRERDMLCSQCTADKRGWISRPVTLIRVKKRTTFLLFCRLYFLCCTNRRMANLTFSTINKPLVFNCMLPLCFPGSPTNVSTIMKLQCYQRACHEWFYQMITCERLGKIVPTAQKLLQGWDWPPHLPVR